jgi:hypothetical protein
MLRAGSSRVRLSAESTLWVQFSHIRNATMGVNAPENLQRQDSIVEEKNETKPAVKSDERVESIVSEFKSGLLDHNLGTFIDHLNDARNSMSPAQYGEFVQGINKSLDAGGVLPDVAMDVLGVDKSGKQLVVADTTEGKAIIVDANGGARKIINTAEALAEVPIPQHYARFANLMQGDGKFSLLLPPGLDTTGTGKLAVKGVTEKRETNADGSVTHRLSGELINAASASNWRGRASNDNTKFDGYYTTSANGKDLLRSHIEYKTKFHDFNWIASMANDLPSVEMVPQATIRELGKGAFYTGKTLDSIYVPLRGSYLTMHDTDPKNVNFWGEVYETRGESATEIKGAFRPKLFGVRSDRAAGEPSERLTYDRTGLISDIEYNRPHMSNAHITRDNNGITELSDKDGVNWKRLGADQWQKTMLDGKRQDVGMNLSVDGAGNIIFKDNNGMRIDSAWGATQLMNNRAQVIEQQSGVYGYYNGKLTPNNSYTTVTKYSYKPDGSPSMQTRIEQRVDKTITVEEPLKEAPKPPPIGFFSRQR